jgi:hypothetical protein
MGGIAILEPVSGEPSLCFRETGFCKAETKPPKQPLTYNRRTVETKCADESPPVRGYSQQAGKSLFARDCVVGLGGLEPPTNRLSVASSEHRPTARLWDFLASEVPDSER